MDDTNKLQVLYSSVKKMRTTAAKAILRDTVLTGRQIDVASERGRTVTTWFHSSGTKNAPILFDLHGGGFVMGDPRKSDAFCACIAKAWKVNVISVGYSLAPENPYPAALEDVCAVLGWYRQNAADLQIDASAIYLQGYSAGANLAFAAQLRLMKQGLDPVQGIIAHYPFFDAMTSPALKNVRDIDLPVEIMEAFNLWYVGGASASNPEISLIFATDEEYKHFPKTMLYAVVGDGLFDEAMSIAVRMLSLGVDSKFHSVQGAYHGYIEDAVNTKVYRETSFPETRAARPAGYRETAQKYVREALTELLGEPQDKELYQKFWETES